MNAKHRAHIALVSGVLLAVAGIAHLAGWRQGADIAMIVGSVIAGVPIARSAIAALRYKQFSIDLLVTIAVVGALFIGAYVESAVVSFLFIFGAFLEARTMAKTRESVREMLDNAPQTANVIVDGVESTIAVDDIEVGDRLVMRTGDMVAVDGTVVSGTGLVNQATVTGEPLPVSVSTGDTVFSGTTMDNGFIEVVADKTGDDSTFAQIIELVEEAQESKTKTQRFLDKFANIYTPAIVVGSLLAYVFTRDIEFALTFLVIACPGALVISTPVSMVAGLGNAAKHGILIKGGDAMEQLGKVKTIVFDKTGTLTQGRPEVVGFTVAQDSAGLPRFDRDQVLALAQVLELGSEHPLGKTIVDFAQTELGEPVNYLLDSELDVAKGFGISGAITGPGGQVFQVAIGSKRMALDLVGADELVSVAELIDAGELVGAAGSTSATGAAGSTGVAGVAGAAVSAGVVGLAGTAGAVELGSTAEQLNELTGAYEALGNTVSVVVIDGQIAAVFAIADQIRPSTAAALQGLRDAGATRLIMLSGDSQSAAEHVANQLGLDEAHGGLLPQDKAEFVNSLKAHGRVAMIGDGVNDAPALASADVGIAMGAGTDISLQTASVILMSSNFDQLVHGKQLARATTRNMRQNTIIALGTVFMLLLGVVWGAVFMSTGMLVHELSVMVVILNAIRLVRFKSKPVRHLAKVLESPAVDCAADRSLSTRNWWRTTYLRFWG